MRENNYRPPVLSEQNQSPEVRTSLPGEMTFDKRSGKYTYVSQATWRNQDPKRWCNLPKVTKNRAPLTPNLPTPSTVLPSTPLYGKWDYCTTTCPPSLFSKQEKILIPNHPSHFHTKFSDLQKLLEESSLKNVLTKEVKVTKLIHSPRLPPST